MSNIFECVKKKYNVYRGPLRLSMKSDETTEITFEEGDLRRGARQSEARWSKAKGEAATAEAGLKFFKTIQLEWKIIKYIYSI